MMGVRVGSWRPYGSIGPLRALVGVQGRGLGPSGITRGFGRETVLLGMTYVYSCGPWSDLLEICRHGFLVEGHRPRLVRDGRDRVWIKTV